MTYDKLNNLFLGQELAAYLGGDIYRVVLLEKDTQFEFSALHGGFVIKEKRMAPLGFIAIAYYDEEENSWRPQVIHIHDVVNIWKDFSQIDACV